MDPCAPACAAQGLGARRGTASLRTPARARTATHTRCRHKVPPVPPAVPPRPGPRARVPPELGTTARRRHFSGSRKM